MGLGHAISDFIFLGEKSQRQRNRGEEATPVSGLSGPLGRVGLVAVFLILLAALMRGQIFQGSYFRALSDGNRVRKVPIHAPRGIIYDRNGTALVSNLPSYRLKNCRPTGQCEISVISKAQAIELQAKGLDDNQTLELDSTRNYIYGPATAHLLGYTGYLGDIVVGRGGLEEQYERTLSGRDGEEVIEVDALGNKLRTLATVLPESGKDLNTNIDIAVQKTAYESIREVIGAVVVTEPNTGAVLALASSPSFDPEHVADYLTDKNQPLFGRAISGTYPPGSTFKIITATAGLETGKITESTEITDPGILIIGPYKFPNWKYLRDGGTQGTLNVVSAIQKSNDIFFYRVGEWVGVDGLVDWAKRFGLASKLGIDLPGEATGSLPNRTDWYLGDTYHLAIGQGDLLVTPLQVNRWTSVIGSNGKICQPMVVGTGGCKDSGISQKTLGLVKQGLVAACSPGGTAWPLFGFAVHGSQYQIACKTGTAEFGDPKDRTHAWLTAYAPVCAEATAGKACQPQIAVTVLIEAGGEGDTAAAPIVKKILETWFTK